MDNIFEKIYENVPVKKFKKVKNIMTYSSLGLLGTDILLIHQNVTANCVLGTTVAAATATASYFAFTRSYKKGHESLFNSVEKPYQKVIDNYDKLINKEFALNNPVKIDTMFRYLLKNGYLSKNNKFNYDREHFYADFEELYGAEVSTGASVCRHTSAMLVDILNKSNSNIEATQLGVSVIDSNMKSYLTAEQVAGLILGNHAITFAIQDERSYFLDQTLDTSYRRSMEDKKILYNDIHKLLINPVATVNLNRKDDRYGKVADYLDYCYPTISLDEEKELIEKTKSLFADNTDIFEKLYSENKDLYSDIDEKLEKVKVKKIKSK